MIYDWAVVGAGPAGIAAVGKLMDRGVPSKNILWVDPAFRVGDFGTLWRNVPSNTTVGLFLRFLHQCKAFQFDQIEAQTLLSKLNPSETCDLYVMADPLQWVSDQIKYKVISKLDRVERIKLSQRHWDLTLTNSVASAKQVILAIGAVPKKLSYPIAEIPLEAAMDKGSLSPYLNATDTVAVFGSSHSAILAVKHCLAHGVKRVINFYRSPLIYAVYLEDWILFDDTGLKGSTAQWARENIDGVVPDNLERIYSNTENIEQHLPGCQKIIYAIGFERRHLPIVEGMGSLEYIEECGIIAPGLFGFGIAFPEAKRNPFNVLEYRVGLWKFMEYIDRILPIWMKYPG